MVKLDVGAGGERYLGWAKRQLMRLRDIRRNGLLSRLSKRFKLGDATVDVVSSDWGDWIRIRAGLPAILTRLDADRFAVWTWQMDLLKVIPAYLEDDEGTVLRDFTSENWDFVAATGNTVIMRRGSGVPADTNYTVCNASTLAIKHTRAAIDFDSVIDEGNPIGVIGFWARNGKGQFLYKRFQDPFLTGIIRTGYAPLDLDPEQFVSVLQSDFDWTLPHNREGVLGNLQLSVPDSWLYGDPTVVGAPTSGAWFPRDDSIWEVGANDHFFVRQVFGAHIEVADFDGTLRQFFDPYPGVSAGNRSSLVQAVDNKNLLWLAWDTAANRMLAKHFAITRNPETEEYSVDEAGTDLTEKLTEKLAALEVPVTPEDFYDLNANAGGPIAINPDLSNEFKHEVV